MEDGEMWGEGNLVLFLKMHSSLENDRLVFDPRF